MFKNKINFLAHKAILWRLLPYIATIILITGPWFFKSGYLFFTDFAWGPKIVLNWIDAWFFLRIIFKTFSFVLPMDILQKLFVSMLLLLILLGGKKIVENFIDNGRLVFVVSLFSLFNPFVYDRMMYGQIGILLGFGFFCLMAGYLLECLKKNDTKPILPASLFAGLSILFANHFVFFVGVFYIIFIILFMARSSKIERRGLAKNLFLAGLIIFILNLNWILGFLFIDSQMIDFLRVGIQKQDFVVFRTAGFSGIEALGNVLMMSGFWGKEQFRYADLTKFKENWGRGFFMLLPLILYGVLTGFKVRKVHKVEGKKSAKEPTTYNLQPTTYLTIGLLVVYVVAVILAVGIRLPVAREITYWLFENIPFYKGLRETQKWVSLVVVVYLIFLSIGAKRLFANEIIQNNRFVSKLVLGGIIVMQAPLLLWGLNGQVRPIEYPNDWYEVDNYIVSESRIPPEARLVMDGTNHKSRNKCEDAILFLPWHAYMSFSWTGKIGSNPANVFFKCPVFRGTNIELGEIFDDSQNPDSALIWEWIFKKGSTDLLRNELLKIHYIILAKELDWGNYAWIEKLEEIKLIKETESLIVYKVIK